MGDPRLMLLIVNIIGGFAVIGSYIQGFVSHPNNTDVLWGDITGSIRTLYLFSMILSALGYFAFFYFILFRLVPSEVKVTNTIGYEVFFVIFIGILLFSSLWMPFSYSYIDAPHGVTWVAIRIVLFLVGLFSCALVWALLSLHTKEPTVPYWLAVAGSIYFAFHTTVLDAFLWPVFYK